MALKSSHGEVGPRELPLERAGNRRMGLVDDKPVSAPVVGKRRVRSSMLWEHKGWLLQAHKDWPSLELR